MAAVTGQARRWVWAAVVLSACVVIGLTLVAVLVDLDTADRIASIVGAGLGALGLVVAVVQLVSPGADAPTAGARSVQAGGSIGRTVTGDRNRIQGPAPAPPSPGSPPGAPSVPGERGVSASGDIGEAVTGDGNEES